jgi:5-methylcytosine-specific restriction endonuclease McrA
MIRETFFRESGLYMWATLANLFGSRPSNTNTLLKGNPQVAFTPNPNKTVRVTRTPAQRRTLQFSLSRRFGWLCWYCGQKFNGGSIHLDHIIPISVGGLDDESNIALACAFCNMAKSDYALDVFLDWLDHVRFGPAWCPIRDGAKNSTC